MTKRSFWKWCLVVIFFMLVSSTNQVLPEGLPEPGYPGKLDLGSYDMPLSYIDRYDYHSDLSEKEKENFQKANNYVLEQKKQREIMDQKALNDIDDVINTFYRIKQKFDESRKSYNYDIYPVYQPVFTTKIRQRHGYKLHGYPYYHGLGSNHYGYQPYINIFNMPGYLGNKESSYDGRDNDGDNFVDEGFSNGNVQIILGDSGINKDDVWELYVDDAYMGINDSGTIRTWDLNLYPGTHNITIVGVHIPDNSGTYSIVFRNASVISGPPLAGENLCQGQVLQWLINVR